MKLREIAHVRTGDKGNDCNICVIPYDEADYAALKEKLTAEVVQKWYRDFCAVGSVERYEVPSLASFNFVLSVSLGGGVTRSLGIDRHGKSLGMALLEIDIDLGKR